ncbi:MAG: hypothetical protein H7Y27_07120, partial [Gemmatimonadaceae bacterium]|nr:hypothetical protein [Chitinophagaceae bacterium]
MRYFSITLAVAAFLCCTDHSAIAQNKRVAVIGSSTALNFNVGYLEGYVGRLDTHYNKIPPQDTFVHRGATGGYSVLKGMPTSHIPAEGAAE